jgi:2-methylcitrate dehydratase PrpD
MDRLSAYMSEARSRAIPDAVVQEAKYHVLDTLAAMISGSQLPPGRQALRFAHAYGDEKIATIVASNTLGGIGRALPRQSALTWNFHDARPRTV